MSNLMAKAEALVEEVVDIVERGYRGFFLG